MERYPEPGGSSILRSAYINAFLIISSSCWGGFWMILWKTEKIHQDLQVSTSECNYAFRL